MNSTPYAALAVGLALAGSSAANAQTVYTHDISQPVDTVITQQPVTVQTTETIRTTRPGHRPTVRRIVTTRQTVISQPMLPAQPLYNVAPPTAAVIANRTYNPPLYDYAPRLYDTVAPVPSVDDTVINAAVPPASMAIPTYRYVYEPDRILVVDPVTNVAIQSIPR
jgi:hypothetical protein